MKAFSLWKYLCLLPLSVSVGHSDMACCDFTGLVSVTPHNGDIYGKWIRTGNLTVDLTDAPKSITLRAENTASGTFYLPVPSVFFPEGTIGVNRDFEVQNGSGSAHFFIGYPKGDTFYFPVGAGPGASEASPGNNIGFQLQADANSSVSLTLSSIWTVVPEPSVVALVTLGVFIFGLRRSRIFSDDYGLSS